MSNGTYGIRKPARVDYNDVDIFYHYRPTRGSEEPGFSEFQRLDAGSVFFPSKFDGANLDGLYNLRLPLENFGKKGIYTIYIRPKAIENVKILDVSTLTGNYTSIRGIVINPSTYGLSDANGGLVGYRVEYPDGSYKIITSNNRCEPVSSNVGGSATEKSVRYRFNDNSNIHFCTLTPSTALSFKANAFPSIGKTGDEVTIASTNFNPVMLEIEMVKHDADTISTMLEGNQIRNLDRGIITTFDEDGNIYHQAAYGNITSDDGLNSDFKLVYTDPYIKNEENRLDEIREQIIENGR